MVALSKYAQLVSFLARFIQCIEPRKLLIVKQFEGLLTTLKIPTKFLNLRLQKDVYD